MELSNLKCCSCGCHAAKGEGDPIRPIHGSSRPDPTLLYRMAFYLLGAHSSSRITVTEAWVFILRCRCQELRHTTFTQSSKRTRATWTAGACSIFFVLIPQTNNFMTSKLMVSSRLNTYIHKFNSASQFGIRSNFEVFVRIGRLQ